MTTHTHIIKRKLKSETLGLYFPVTYRFEVEILDHDAGPRDVWNALHIHRLSRLCNEGQLELPINWPMIPDENGLESMLIEVWEQLNQKGLIQASTPNNPDFDDDARQRNAELRTYVNSFLNAV